MKQKQYIQIGIISILMLFSILFGYKLRDTKISNILFRINNLKSDTTNLKLKMIEDSLDLKNYSDIINDKHYIRYIAYTISDINIPKNINHEDLKIINRMSIKFDIPKRYLYRLIFKESTFNPNAKSIVGAKGYMQVMPCTFNSMRKLYIKDYGKLDKYTRDQQNIILGTYYLRHLHNIYHNWRKTFAHYNCGTDDTKLTESYINFITK